MKKDCKPVLDGKHNESGDSGTNSSGKNPLPELSTFRQFMPLFLGGVLGTLIGYILVEILAQFL